MLDYAQRHKRDARMNDGVVLDLFVGRSAGVPDIVQFRLDTAAFLGTLPPRDREIALTLAIHTTTETARKYGVTPGAISQFRTRFRKKYDEFHAAI